MRRTRVLWEVYVTRFEEALDRYKRHRLSAEEAGELLGLSGRTSAVSARATRWMGSTDCGTGVWVVCRTAVRLRANWRGCGGCIARSMPTSR